MTVTVPAQARTEARTLVSDEMFARLEGRIAADHPELAKGMAARIVDQALAFLAACATATRPLAPSELVDIGWHTFILYTREYAAFCTRIAGRFIHHEPDDAPGDGWPTAPQSNPLVAAVTAIKAAGLIVDAELWNLGADGNCTQCHAGCHDSPTR